MKKPSFLKLEDGNKLAYHKFSSTSKENMPGIVFMGGFKSDMQGTKAVFLEEYCTKNNIDFIRFDYFGHGESSGEFVDGTIGIWKDNALAVIDELTKGSQILIGSSLGGWIILLATLERPERVSSLIGIAPAPDFTEDLIWNIITDEERAIIEKEGIYNLPSEYCDDPEPEPDPYPITDKLIKEARNHLLLRSEANINCPVRLIHGAKDADVPPETSDKIKEKLTSKDVEIITQEDGDHRMSSPLSLEIIKKVLEKLLYFNT